MPNNTAAIKRYSYTECETLMAQCFGNDNMIEATLRSFIDNGMECSRNGAETESDALGFFTYVLEYTTYVLNDEVILVMKFKDIAAEAFKALCSLSSAESDYVWERSSMTRTKYMHLFEKH